jgi:hypothetical protein
MFTTALALTALAASTAQADSYLDQTCIECGTCDPFPAVIDEADMEAQASLGFPFDLAWVSVEGLEAEYQVNPYARACPADDDGFWHPVTLVFAVAHEDVDLAGAMLKDWSQNGETWAGGIDLEIAYDAPDGTQWIVELGNLEYMDAGILWENHTDSYGWATDPDHPHSFLFELSVQPSWGEVSAWVPSRR